MNLRPNEDEYIPYYSKYIAIIPEGEIVQILQDQIHSTIHFLNGLSEDQGSYKYEKGKWSVKEVIGHIADTERIMAYRLLRFARGDKEALLGFNENTFVEHANFDRHSLRDLLDNLHAVRQSTIHLLKGLDEEAWYRWGSANGGEVTVRAIAFIIAGHELHHRQVINDRYIQSKSFPKM